MLLDKSLAILELLATHPGGLTIFEIVAHLGSPAHEVIGSIAILQRRRWLRSHAPGDHFVLGERLAELSDGR